MAPNPFDSEMSSADVEGLVAAGVAEGIGLEFKAEPYKPDHDGVREFLKDVTSFANTAGGVLIIGVTEADGIASGVTPINPSDVDSMKLRLESLLQDAIEPRIFGIRLQPISVTGGQVLAIRIPRSLAGPHRVSAKRSNRFYLRSSAGAYEASIDELRDLFTQGAAMSDRALAFCEQRLSRLLRNEGSLPLAPADSRIVLHIVPFASLAANAAMDISDIENLAHPFRPIGGSGFSYAFNADGYIMYRGGQACHGYTQVFRTGAVEAVKLDFLQGANPSYLIAPDVEELLRIYLPRYIDGLRALGLAPPFFVSVAVQGTAGALVLFDASRWVENPQPLRDSEFRLPLGVVHDFGTVDQYLTALKPALNALWNAGGVSRWSPSRG